MYNSINEEIVHVKGIPQKLIIFLHGYLDTSDQLEQAVLPILNHLDNVALHLPQAPFACELAADKRQWFSMHRFDEQDRRKQVATMQECASIYNLMTPGLEEARFYLDEYIDNCLNEYLISAQDLYLCGFSQGAMVALHTSLLRPQTLGGCISFSGMLAGHGFLLKHHSTVPDILLLHGNQDSIIRLQAQEFTRQQLLAMGAQVESQIINRGKHQINMQSLQYAADFINRHQAFRKRIGA